MTTLPLSLPVSFDVTNGSSRKDLNVTIESSPKLGTDVVCVDQSVNLTCVTDQQVKDITWQWLGQSEEGSTISVQATRSEVVYTCKVSYNNSQMGEANIIVVANGERLKLKWPDHHFSAACSSRVYKRHSSKMAVWSHETTIS